MSQIGRWWMSQTPLKNLAKYHKPQNLSAEMFCALSSRGESVSTKVSGRRQIFDAVHRVDLSLVSSLLKLAKG